MGNLLDEAKTVRFGKPAWLDLETTGGESGSSRSIPKEGVVMNNVQKIQKALKEGRGLLFEYPNPETGEVIERKLLPCEIFESKDGNRCVKGFEMGRKAQRTFRVDRIPGDVKLTRKKRDLVKAWEVVLGAEGKQHVVFPGSPKTYFKDAHLTTTVGGAIKAGFLTKPTSRIVKPVTMTEAA